MASGADTGASLAVSVALSADPDFADEERDLLVRRLRTELAELDLESIEWAPGQTAPPSTKGAELAEIGAILIAMSASGGVFPTLLDTIKDWLARQSASHRVSITIDGDTIELERATSAQKQDLVDAYVRRHTEQ